MGCGRKVEMVFASRIAFDFATITSIPHLSFVVVVVVVVDDVCNCRQPRHRFCG